MIPTHSKIGQEMRIHFEKLLNEYGKNELIPLYLQNDTANFHLNRQVKSEETHSVSDAEQCFEKENQQSGNGYGRGSALVSPMTTLNRDAVPIGDDIESVGGSRVDVETGNEEEQEPEDCGHAVYRIWCAVCINGGYVGKHLQVEPSEEEDRERTNPMVAFDCVFLTQENSDIFPILICRDNRHGQIPLLVDLIKDLESPSPRIILKDENEPSLKIFQEVMIYSCVEVVVREMKTQC